MTYTIMVIDDDSFFRSLAKDILEQNGYEVLVASSWTDFNEAYYSSKTPPDIILFDINLGTVLSGDKLLAAFKKNVRNGSSGKQTKLVLLSGLKDDELSAIANDCGADGYIRKTSLNVEYGGAIFMQQIRSFLE
jgi:CheY-like chemotaxis protein